LGKQRKFILRSVLRTDVEPCRDLRASLSGRDVPEDVKTRLLAIHEENVNLKEQYKTAQEKLLKARAVSPMCFYENGHLHNIHVQFIKSQDRLFKEEHAAKATLTPVCAWEP
jgi:protein HOOK3